MARTIYLSARWDRRAEMHDVRRRVESFGHRVLARWLNEKDGTPPADAAENDLEDIDRCDAIVVFSEKPDIGYYTGGRHVELGYALAHATVSDIDIDIVVVGPRENIFFHLPEVTVVEDLEAAIKHLNATEYQ